MKVQGFFEQENQFAKGIDPQVLPRLHKPFHAQFGHDAKQPFDGVVPLQKASPLQFPQKGRVRLFPPIQFHRC